jgi:hypothetical protein
MTLATSPATDTPAHTSRPGHSPEELWALFAPALAGRERIRVRTTRGQYRDGGRLRPEVLPVQPAAVLIFDNRARARCLVLDLDAKAAGRSQVVLDCLQVTELATRAGLPVLVDESPNGGRHVYLPLEKPISADEALEAGRALRTILASLDLAPLSNASTGAIRPPGSAHPLGGHQVLVTELADATAAVFMPGSSAAWARFGALLLQSGSAAAPRTPRGRLSAVPDLAAARPALDPYLSILRTGAFDSSVYCTPSEARFAALCHLLRRGWLAQDIARAAVDGTFPGLLKLLSRHHNRLQALNSELGRATQKLTSSLDRPADQTSHTREHQHPRPHPPATEREPPTEYAFLRSWWTAARHTGRLRKSTSSLVDRSVLQALGALAQMKGSRYVDAGCRSLAQAACFDHSTVARSLKRLAAESEPHIVLLQASEATDGQQGDLYELVIPAAHALLALSDPWSPGLIERIHPAFLELVRASRYVYAALSEHGRTSQELLRDAGVARESFRVALAELAAHGLAREVPDGWARGYASLNQVARRTGADLRAELVRERHLAERRAWRALKGLTAPAPDRALPHLAPSTPPAPNGYFSDGVPIPAEPDEVPPTEAEALALLASTLGATLLAG